MFWLAEIFNGPYSPQEMERLERWAHQRRADDFHSLLSAIGSGVAKTVSASGSAIKTVARWTAHGYRGFARRQRRRAAIRELNALGDNVLRDIGLVRGDIPQVVDTMLRQEPATPTRTRRPELQSVPTRRAASSDTGEHDWRRAA